MTNKLLGKALKLGFNQGNNEEFKEMNIDLLESAIDFFANLSVNGAEEINDKRDIVQETHEQRKISVNYLIDWDL